MAKKIIRCAKCGCCSVYRPAGFIACKELVCKRTNESVDEDDGCTFGIIGEPSQGIVPYDVDLSSSCGMQQYWYEY